MLWRDISGSKEGRNRGEKVQGRSSIISRQKIQGEIKMVQETEDSKNLYVQPTDMN